VNPVLFPASDPEWEMGQSKRHLRLCDLVYKVLCGALGSAHTVGSDQFIYLDASDPRRKCAPDAFVKLGVPDADFESWKIWERDRGTPDLCVEILSPSDTMEKQTWEEKMERYLAMGTPELVAFDVDAPVGARLRAWDRLADDLVEREVHAESTPCAALGLHWVIVPSLAPDGSDLPAALRLARDPLGTELILTGAEARAYAEAERADAEAERADAEATRADAETTRADAETTRADAETTRARAVDTENARLRAELEALRGKPI
jgi:hypothetical protein